MITSDAAAPYVELNDELPRYKLIRYLPTVKRMDVKMAPNHTYLHEITTSGSTL